MPSLLTLVVAYAGITGAPAKVDTQVRSMIEAETEVADADITRAERKELVKHGSDAAEIVQRLDVTGLVIGELKKNKKGSTLTIVVYGHDGAMVNLIDLPVGASGKKAKKVKKLAADDLDSVRDAVIPSIQQVVQTEAEELEKARAREREVAAEEERREAEAEAATVAAAEAEAAAARAAARKKRGRATMVRAHVGIGARGRTFVPETDEIRGYRSTPVPAARLVAEITPIKYVGIDLEGERTLTMTSDLDGTPAASSILRWHATGALRLPLGSVEVAAIGGIGGREFVIDANDPPTPNGHYLYAVAGARIGVRLGKRVEVRGTFAYEPVIGGAEDTMSTLGPSTRSAIEVGGAVYVAATDHLYVVGEGNYQRFTWVWDSGNATDEYPSGTLSVGASY